MPTNDKKHLKRCRVKCLGKSMRDLVPGDVAQLYVHPSGERLEQLDAQLKVYLAAHPSTYIGEVGGELVLVTADPEDRAGEVAGSDFDPTGLLYRGEESDIRSWHIAMSHGYATFIDGVFSSWDRRVEDDLPIVGSYGRPLDIKDLRLGWSDLSGDCELCAELRGEAADVADS
jgi:hypothetical protein